jgi:hypothetical protein
MSSSDPRERFGLDLPGGSARARDAHEEVAEAIVEPLDVKQHSHGRMVRTTGGPCSCGPPRAVYERISLHTRQKFSSDARHKLTDAP